MSGRPFSCVTTLSCLGDYLSNVIGNIKYLICHVTDSMIKGSCNFMCQNFMNRFGDLGHSGSKDIIFLICHVI